MTSNMFGGTNIFAIPSKTSNPFQTTPPRPSSPFGSTNSSAQQKQQIMPTKPALQDLQSKIGSKTSGFGSKGEKLGGNQTFGLRNEIIHSGEQKASDTTPKEDMKSSDHSSKNEESTKSPSTPTKLPYSEWQSAVHNSISSTIRDTLPDLDDGKVENLAKALQPTIEKSAVMQSFLTTPASSTFPFQLYGYPQMQFQIPHFQTNETTKIIGNKQITETPEGLQVIVWPEGMDPKTIPKSPPMMYPMMQQMPMMQQCERSSDKSTKDDKNKQSPDAQVPPPQMPMMPPMMSPMMPQMPMMPPMMYPMMQPMPMMPPMMQQMPMMPPMMYPMMQPMPMMQQMPMTPQMMQQPMQSKEASSKDGKNKAKS
ncbi:hypothetical protein GPJ56_009144 [Histomonas meleagridis]|nr:hypothetical protein GPJ56_009144 [Histomonas meleagridis]